MTRSEGSQHSLSFEKWKAAVGNQLPLRDPERLPSLYKAIRRNELIIQQRDGEPVRFGRMIGIHIHYQATDGRVYKLKEGERSRVKEGVSFEEALTDKTARIPSPAREFDESVSERLTHAEDPREGAIRGIYEELFEYTLAHSEREYPHLETVLREHLTELHREELVMSPDDDNNSYKGLTSIYDTTTYSLSLASDMDLPIAEDEQGVPKPLVELVDEDGNDRFINFFIWREVVPQQIIKR